MKSELVWAEMRRLSGPQKSKTTVFSETCPGFLPERISGLYLPKWMLDELPEVRRCHLLLSFSTNLIEHDQQRQLIRHIIQTIRDE